MKSIRLITLCIAWGQLVHAQESLPYKNPQLPIETRVQDLLKRMTPEEKFWQLFMIPGDLGADPANYQHGIFGFQVNTTQQQSGVAAQMLQYEAGASARETLDKINAIQRYFVEKTRLGIPIIAFDESLHGLIRQGATAFPQAIALAATWDTLLMQKVATAIAIETKARGIRHILSPVVNLATDVRWGRVEETYGEDPYLTTQMGLAFVRAFEQRGVVTTPKHFAVNHGEGGRDSYPIHYNERLLEETYLAPFKALVQEGGARSLMTAYNSLDGSPCSANDWLLNKKLRQDWGFRGFTLSDAGATGGANVLHFTAANYAQAGKQSVENGQDVMFQTAYEHHSLFMPPYLDGSISSQAIDSAVSRVLRIKFELGLFEQPYMSDELLRGLNLNNHRILAREAAARSIVLLKNEKNILPLTATSSRIAVIGTDAAEARLGGYSGPGNDKISILDGLRKIAGNTSRVQYTPGPGRHHQPWTFVPSGALFTTIAGEKKQGLLGEYYNNASLTGKPALTRVDADIRFQWTLFSPDPEKINYDFFSARWSGKITAPQSGRFNIGIDGNDGYRLYINNRLLIDNWQKQSYHTHLVPFYFEKGKAYDIRVEYYEPSGNAWFRLIWDVNVKDSSEQKIAEAVALTRRSDIAIVVAGIEEGEFNDRASLQLPGKQEKLIRAVAATGKPVIVVLVGGSAITMTNWIDSADAILDVWYPGETGGDAVAGIISGKYNPAGRLPVTFPLAEAQLPLVYNHKPTGRGDDYTNLSGQPLFPFGFGLSYTTFSYSNLRFNATSLDSNGTLLVSCDITNSGNRPGDEVVQLYTRDELASVARPVKELKAFERITLAPGKTKTVQFTLPATSFRLLNKDMQWAWEPGAIRIMIGASSADIRLRDHIYLK